MPRTAAIAIAIAVLVAIVALGIATAPLSGGLVDWGMDGDLTPGLWEPSHWLIGALLSVIMLVLMGGPAIVVVAIVIAVGIRVRGRSEVATCASCGASVDTEAGRCATCGPVRPRRPRGAEWGWLKRAPLAGAAIGITGLLAILVGSGWAWVQLELEEDAFARRAEAAAAAGAAAHAEPNRYGSRLMWSVENGYSSHRD